MNDRYLVVVPRTGRRRAWVRHPARGWIRPDDVRITEEATLAVDVIDSRAWVHIDHSAFRAEASIRESGHWWDLVSSALLTRHDDRRGVVVYELVKS